MKKYIANIVYDGYMKEQEIFNVVKDFGSIDRRFPVLIIGWDIVKSLFPGISILDWKIDDNIYWTHRKNVKRTRYEEDIKKFKELAIKKIEKNVKYKSLNILTDNIDIFNRFLAFVSNDEKKYCFITDKEAYVYKPRTNSIVGVSFDEIDYIGFDKEEIKSFIKSKPNTVIYNEYDIPFDIKNRKTFRKYMVPYLISLYDSM